jgi:urate oxidase
MRKQILTSNPTPAAPFPGTLDVAALATVAVTSETAGHPVENAFDARCGLGGSRWVAETPGDQTLILAFDTPQNLRQVSLEVEETQDSRTQELDLAVSHDGGNTYRELVRQEFNFAPPGTTFEREAWAVAAEQVTHLRLCIRPDKGGRTCRASLTNLSLR